MSDYQVTARKWRPQTFETVIGQEHVTKTLKNAIKSGRIGHSYLFSGPRGVGKTTLARILVKALNCQNGPTPSPCGECPYCIEINENRSLDYLEIDGASNRGIDQIRDINEHIKYASVHNKHRIFVIDEVHMLTIEAFNALLKSLEEPPAKVIFIFCTTEPHKVPLTIRSRCQHYSFRTFPIDQLSAHLQTIMDAENVTYEEEAPFYIARAANGSMRDSQSILDQAIAYCGRRIEIPALLEVLGVNASDICRQFIKQLHQGALDENIKLFYTLLRHGKEPRQFLFEILAGLNSMLYIRSGITDLNLLELSKSDFEILSEYARDFSDEEIFTLSDLAYEFIRELKNNIEESVLFKYYLAKMHRYRELITPGKLKGELLQLSSRFKKEPEAELSPAPPESNPAKTENQSSDSNSSIDTAVKIFDGTIIKGKE